MQIFNKIGRTMKKLHRIPNIIMNRQHTGNTYINDHVRTDLFTHGL